MKNRKTKSADLENKRFTHLLIGLIISLSFVYYSFEYKTYNTQNIYIDQGITLVDDEDFIIQTERKLEPPPVKLTTSFVIIDKPDIDIPDIELYNIEGDNDDTLEFLTFIEEPLDIEPDFFVFVEEQPSYPGGEIELMKYLSTITYPELAKEARTQGIVYISFIVEKDGVISNITLERGIGSGCDKAALKIVEKMKKWNPGKQRMRPVRVKLNLPIKFQLN